jgi:hypothetical protein
MERRILGHPTWQTEGRDELGRSRNERRAVADTVPAVVAFPAHRHLRTVQRVDATL